MDINNIKDLINNLFRGNITSEELKKLNLWYDSFNTQEEINIFSAETDNNEIVKQRILNGINSKRDKPKHFNNFFLLYKNVAIIFISISILLVSLIIYLDSTKIENEISWNEIKVSEGQKKIVSFLDNSKIIVNAGSYLKYPKKINQDSIEIYLEGEAYFEITPNKNRKFIVHTSSITTTVLGTKFNINAFNQDEETSVTLVEGRVKVEQKLNNINTNSYILKPLEKYLIINNQKEILRNISISEEIGWKDNVLIFSRKSLKHILKVLSRSYGVKFILTNNKYSEKKFTANFNNASFSTVIKSIEKLTNLNVHIENDEEKQTIVFY